MSEGWDTPRTRHFASWLDTRRERGRLGSVGEALAGLPSRGEDTLAFVEALLAAAAQAGVEARFGWRPGDHDHDVPYGVIKAMLDNQKPFQLWNVERVEVKYGYRLEPGPELRVGQAAELEPDEQIPRAIETSTRALIQELDQAETQALIERSRRRAFGRLLRDPLPFGVPDPVDAAPPAPRAAPRSGAPRAAPPPIPSGLGPPPPELPSGMPPHIAERLRKKREEQRRRKSEQERERGG